MSRQTISYPAMSGSLLASHLIGVSFDRFVGNVTFFGRAGAEANAASDAAFTRATLAM